MIDEVEIVLENCETISLKPNELFSLYLGDLHTKAFANALNSCNPTLIESTVSNDFHISIYTEALKNKHTSLLKNALFRLEDFNDIAQIYIYTKEKFKKRKEYKYLIAYEEDANYNNKLQSYEIETVRNQEIITIKVKKDINH
jgi:hypothetical protein